MTITRVPLLLGAVSILASLAGWAMILFAASVEFAGIPLHRSALVLLAGVAPAAFLSAIALLLPSRRVRAIVIPLIVLGGAASALFAVAFAVGFDEADAGGPRSALSNAAGPAVLAAFVLLAAAFAVGVGSLLPLGAARRTLLGALVGVVAAPAVLTISLFGHQLMAVFGVGLVLALVIVRAREQPAGGAAQPAPGVAPSPDASVSGTIAPSSQAPSLPPLGSQDVRTQPTREIRTAAAVSLAISLLTFGGGLVAGLALSGLPGATQAMGLMLAAGHLAAVPLVVALTLRLAPGRLVALVGTLAGAVGIAACCVYLAANNDPANPHAFTAMLGIAASVGIWAASVAWTRAASVPTLSRVGVAVLAGIGAALVYALVAIGTAGAVLALASGYLLFRGIRKPRAPQPTLA